MLMLLFSPIYSVPAQNPTPTNSSTNAVPMLPPAAWPVYKPAIEGMNVPITFYGRVVDQDGKALPRAQVVLRVQRPHFDPRYIATAEYVRSELTTDANGNFALTGITGRGLDLVSITKPGYVLEPNAKLDYGSESGSIDSPIRFVLWEEGRKSPLISGDKDFDFIPDGRHYALNLSSRTITQATGSEGDFQFWLTRSKGVGKWDKFDWSFEFEGQNGNSLQRTDEGYMAMLFAPNDGYKSAYDESHHGAEPTTWRGGGSEQFYIKLNGQEYGKLSLAWDTVAAAAGPKTNEAGIRIQYTINPTGSPLVR
jgi:hypothetical protein